ncbi:MAG: hypothetical protein OJI67_07080 [Prosthecobacter sp.]|nr:hypothetical protein [Prosthecobacter sp.]
MTPTTDIGDKLVASEPIHRCMTKGVKGAPDQFEYGLSWVTSRRAILKVFPERLECGDWNIPYSAIELAVLLETKQWFIPCYVLKVQAADTAYQFGLNPNKFWKGDLPFQAERQKGKLKYSAYSIAIRVVLVIGLIWYFYTRSK